MPLQARPDPPVFNGCDATCPTNDPTVYDTFYRLKTFVVISHNLDHLLVIYCDTNGHVTDDMRRPQMVTVMTLKVFSLNVS